MLALRQAPALRSFLMAELVGQGGFAKVYRASPVGQRNAPSVAIKVLNDANPPDEVVQRFRDEARILGMSRDRALLDVEPALMLNHRWAVVMEFASGANCNALLERNGPIPVRVALEVVGEVARALGRMYYQPGPDGAPLRLIHRDIKPSNIQITDEGEVKLLDFGVARASFDERESHTTHSVQGTYGYIAPERLRGIDGPAVDSYGLGMVLYKLVTAGPTKRKLIAQYVARTQGAEGHALALADAMVALEHEARPSLREVAECCRDLVQRIDGPGLVEWAREFVPEGIGTTDDPLCGTVLTETPEAPVTPPPSKAPARARTLRRALATARGQLPWAMALAVLVGLAAATWAVIGYEPALVSQLPTFLTPPPSEGLEPSPGATLEPEQPEDDNTVSD